MVNAFLMILLIIVLMIITLLGLKIDMQKNTFMDSSDTIFFRGFWCIVIVLVHVPDLYQNRIQDIIGSFAYIGVTYFFMTSAYGLKYSINHKKNYMCNFWKRRLPSLLIPALIANAFTVVIHVLNGENVTLFSFFNINDWVKVLLLMYIAFWVIYGVAPRVYRSGKWQDVFMILFVIVCSLIQRLTPIKPMYIWTVEPLGFAYGIVVAKYHKHICEWLNDKWITKIVFFAFTSSLLGILYIKCKQIPIAGDYFLKILLGIAITMFMYCLIFKLKVGNKINSFLAKISYEIYLLHGAVFVLLVVVTNGTIGSAQFIWIALLLTILFAVGLNKISKRLIQLLEI